MSFLAHAFEVVVIAGVVGLLVLGAVFLLARASLRRYWRVLRHHPVTRGALGVAAVASAAREASVARRSPEELSRGTGATVRRRMWAAIVDAERCVAAADAGDAPVAELPAVCASLRRVAQQLDGLLRMERRLPSGGARPSPVRRQVAEVITAARDVQRVALQAGSDATEPQLRALVRQARDEVDIVSSALTRLRTIAQPR